MMIGILPPGDPGVFRPLLLPEVTEALDNGEPVTVLTLTQQDAAVGALAGYLDHARFQILSLYIAPDYRRCGGGRMLIEALFHALDGYASGIDISFTLTRPEHRTLPSFLTNMGFSRVPSTEETLYLTTLGQAAHVPFFDGKSGISATPFTELSPAALAQMERAARQTGAPVPKGGFRAQSIDRSVSLVSMSGGSVAGYLVFERTPFGDLTLSAAWSDSKNLMHMPGLLRNGVAKLRDRYSPETKIMIQAVTPASAGLIRTLLPDAEAISYTYSCSFDEYQ